MDNLRRLPVEPLDADDENRITALLLEVIRWIADGVPLDRTDTLTGSLRSSTLRLAKLHGLAPALYAALRHTDPAAAEQFPALRRAYLVQAAHAALGLEQLRAILDAASSAGVRCMPWKGSDTSFTLYRDPALRALSDIDVLVEEVDADRAMAVLTDLGYAKVETAMSREEEWINLVHLAGVRMSRGRELPIEVHTNLLRGYGNRHIAVADAWAHSQMVDMEGVSVSVLAREMAFIAVALHLLGNIERSIPQLKDLADLLLLARQIDAHGEWDQVWRFSRAWGVRDEVRQVAALINESVGARVPDAEGSAPTFTVHDIALGADLQCERAHLGERIGLRLQMARHLPNLGARLRLYAGFVLPRPGYLRWRYRVPPGRPVWPYYLRHLKRAAIRLPYDALVRSIGGRRGN